MSDCGERPRSPIAIALDAMEKSAEKSTSAGPWSGGCCFKVLYSMSDRVYLDWNATSPLRREAREAMAPAWDLCGNPSSVHAEGREARRLVEDARAAVAAAVGALPRNVVFTSGGTEANALALTPGLRRGSGLPVERLLVSAIEHTSVLAGGRFPTEAISSVGVTSTGLVDLDR